MLELQNISVQFGGIKALNNVSFKIEKKSLFSIIGPNGAGKTSLLNVISGRYKANSGKLFYKSLDITNLHPNKRPGLGIGRNDAQTGSNGGGTFGRVQGAEVSGGGAVYFATNIPTADWQSPVPYAPIPAPNDPPPGFEDPEGIYPSYQDAYPGYGAPVANTDVFCVCRPSIDLIDALAKKL